MVRFDMYHGGRIKMTLNKLTVGQEDIRNSKRWMDVGTIYPYVEAGVRRVCEAQGGLGTERGDTFPTHHRVMANTAVTKDRLTKGKHNKCI